MAAIDHYEKLADQYEALAKITRDPLLAKPYKKLAEDYTVLAFVHGAGEANDTDKGR
jgi:hypothetical protein